DGVSFTIRPGEILGYLGPNGAGKSTTVKVLTGLIEPTEGEILWNGRNVKADFTSFQRKIGYVPEEPHLYPHLTGREYLQLVGRLQILRSEEHTSELQSRENIVCRLLLEKKNVDISSAPLVYRYMTNANSHNSFINSRYFYCSS